MKLDEILQLISEDSVISEAHITTESARTPKLHAKYYTIYIAELKVLKSIELRMDELKLKAFEYYSHFSSDEVYQARPLHRKPLKSEIEMYVSADPDIIKIRGDYELQKMKVKTLEDFIKSISQRSFIIKNMIDWEKYKNAAL